MLPFACHGQWRGKKKFLCEQFKNYIPMNVHTNLAPIFSLERYYLPIDEGVRTPHAPHCCHAWSTNDPDNKDGGKRMLNLWPFYCCFKMGQRRILIPLSPSKDQFSTCQLNITFHLLPILGAHNCPFLLTY